MSGSVPTANISFFAKTAYKTANFTCVRVNYNHCRLSTLTCIREVRRIGKYAFHYILNVGIHCWINFQTAVVYLLGCEIFRVTFLSHKVGDNVIYNLVNKVWSNTSLILPVSVAYNKVTAWCLCIFSVCDITEFTHFAEYKITFFDILIRMYKRIVFWRELCYTCDWCRFGKRKGACVFVKVSVCGSLNTVTVVSEIYDIQIHCKYFVFCKLFFKCNRTHHFFDLTRRCIFFFIGYIFYNLLSNRTTAIVWRADTDFWKYPFTRCTECTFYINTVVLVETFILDWNDSVFHNLRYLRRIYPYTVKIGLYLFQFLRIAGGIFVIYKWRIIQSKSLNIHIFNFTWYCGIHSYAHTGYNYNYHKNRNKECKP